MIAALWTVWWLLAAGALETGLNKWLDDRRAAGWQADVDAPNVSGFPGKFDLGLGTLALQDPETGLTVTTDGLRVTAPSYWPGQVTVHLPQSPINISTPDIALALTAKQAQATMRLRPTPDLQLDHLTATGGPWQIDLPQGKLLAAKDFRAEMAQGDRPDIYRIQMEASQPVPGELIRTALALPLDWPRAFDVLVADITVTLDAPLDRFTLENRRPHPRAIQLDRVTLVWGPLTLDIQGRVSIDSTGLPDGQFDLLFENWREGFQLAKNTGALPAKLHTQAEIMLNALANLGDDPERLELKLRFAQGQAFLGSIPLGPAPRLVLP